MNNRNMNDWLKIIGGIIVALAIPAGIGSGLCTFAYGVYIGILLFKGTLAISFWPSLKAVVCFCGAAPIGVGVFALLAFVGAIVMALGE